MQRPCVHKFLAQLGYREFGVVDCIERLKNRFGAGGEFPHEIGLFLGYPLADVIGFIENAGRNCKCNGYWKVYSDECEAARLFAKFRHCKNIYAKLFDSRKRSIYQLTVAA